ncbi:hypothetical protein IQ238_18995 [Pleurocapsales cyanobacterium LEGE 06147]|nr:hypothetical protein [Pleurocapsales cyanobacterium LEGE 06147]
MQTDSTVEARKKFLSSLTPFEHQIRLDIKAAFDDRDLDKLERAIALAAFCDIPMITLVPLTSDNLTFNKTNQNWFETEVIPGVNWSERCIFDSQLIDFCQRCCIKYGVINPFQSIEWKLPK